MLNKSDVKLRNAIGCLDQYTNSKYAGGECPHPHSRVILPLNNPITSPMSTVAFIVLLPIDIEALYRLSKLNASIISII